MKNAKTAWIIAFICLGIYEIYSLLNRVKGDTLSDAIWDWAEMPIISFAFGVLMGHFFWQRKIKKDDEDEKK